MMKLVVTALELTFFAVFFVCVISLPFAWRLGSLPSSSSWLRERLPCWLIARLEKKGRDDPELWLRLVWWVSRTVWIVALVVGVLAIMLATVGLCN